MQIASQIFPFFEIPSWAVRLVVLLLILGFPIALVLAWAFELTPEGLKREKAADGESAKPSRDKAWRQTESVKVAAKSIAILPFENLSEEKANAYFAEGIQNEILTRLAAVRDLKVISRTSTVKYQSKPDNLKTVAQELGVSTILEGAVQKAGDKVRVNVHLIDANADTHRSEEHTSELQSLAYLVCRLLLEKK